MAFVLPALAAVGGAVGSAAGAVGSAAAGAGAALGSAAGAAGSALGGAAGSIGGLFGGGAGAAGAAVPAAMLPSFAAPAEGAAAGVTPALTSSVLSGAPANLSSLIPSATQQAGVGASLGSGVTAPSVASPFASSGAAAGGNPLFSKYGMDAIKMALGGNRGASAQPQATMGWMQGRQARPMGPMSFGAMPSVGGPVPTSLWG